MLSKYVYSLTTDYRDIKVTITHDGATYSRRDGRTISFSKVKSIEVRWLLSNAGITYTMQTDNYFSHRELNLQVFTNELINNMHFKYFTDLTIEIPILLSEHGINISDVSKNIINESLFKTADAILIAMKKAWVFN
jgi:hypothetical protein